MVHKTNVQVTTEFLAKADLPDSDYYIKFQLAQKIVEGLTKEELEKLFKFKIYDYRKFNFEICYDENLREKMRSLQREMQVEYHAEIEIEPEITFEQCLREEFLINTQNYPHDYHDLFFKKFERAEQRFRELSIKN